MGKYNISGKDLDYLVDMFNWNYSAYKNVTSAYLSVSDSNARELMERAKGVFYNSLLDIVNILEASYE